MEEIPIHVYLRIDDLLYRQVVTNDIGEGDLVIDTKDWLYGYCDMRVGNEIVIRYGIVTEVAVPISRVRKLIPIISPLNNN